MTTTRKKPPARKAAKAPARKAAKAPARKAAKAPAREAAKAPARKAAKAPARKAAKAPARKAAKAPARKAAKAPAREAAKAPARKAAKAPARKAAKGSAHARLEAYREKRNFASTREPAGTGPGSARARAATPEHALQYVVQKHDASRLHYDFRLELDGVLLSWSVPKGPSLTAGERRLAVRTEDHPLAYADFEGVIPAGEYGGGSVIVWDRGTWTAESDAHKGMKKGHLDFVLHGEKLRGRFHLVRTKGMENGQRARQEHWLLLKAHDAEESAEEIIEARPESVLSGRTVEAVAEHPKRIWHSKPKHSQANRAAEKRRDPALDVLQLVQKFELGFPLTNLDKVLYPEAGLRKAELIAYYACVASTMLPYVERRPLTVVRCPEGRTKPCFYQKHASEGVPDVVTRVAITGDAGTEQYMAVEDGRALLALGQLGALELHTWGCRTDDVEHPDLLVIDIDPDVGLAWENVVEAAFEVRRRCTELSLQSFVKTTGGKGLHVTVPLSRKLSWSDHKRFSANFVAGMVADAPKKYVDNARKALRKGKIYLDYLRNGRGATFIAPYSPRAREGATVATPITWEELEAGVKPIDFNVRSVVARLESALGDPWRELVHVRQSVPKAALKAMR